MSAPLTPEVLWAQRSSPDVEEKNVIYLTINAADIPASDVKLDISASKISFSGASKTRSYAVDLELFDEIVPDKSKSHITSRGVEFTLRKKEKKEEFWPRLLKEKKKLHFVKTDFDKWVDEDEQEEALPAEDPMAGGGGMGGMPPGMDMSALGGMGGAGGMGGMDFSQLGGMGGAGGMGGMDFSQMGGMGGMDGLDMSALSGAGAGGEADEGEDDDMPELEEATPAETAPAAAADAGEKTEDAPAAAAETK